MILEHRDFSSEGIISGQTMKRLGLAVLKMRKLVFEGEKKVYQDVGEEHKKRSGIPFQTMKLLSYLRENVLHFCLDLSAWLCEWL